MNKDKSNFMMGLFAGIAAMSLLGFIVMSVVYFSGDGEGKKITEKVEKNNVVNNVPTPTPRPTPTAAKVVNLNVSNDTDHIRGNKNAKVTIVEYSDIQCPFCSRFHDTMKQVMAAYPNDVKWVYRHFPLDRIHPVARKAAEASECAAEQGRYWEYVDELYANQSSISESYLTTAAKKVGLNTSKFDTCVDSGKYASKVEKDLQGGQSNGVTGTPGNFINGEILKGAVPFSTLKARIDAIL